MIKQIVFCKEMFMYYEDVDLNYKVKKAGYKVVSVPQAKITHLVGKSMNGGNEEEKEKKRHKLDAESQAVFLTNHYSKTLALSLLNTKILDIKIKEGLFKIVGKDTSRHKGAIKQIKYIKQVVKERNRTV